MDVRTADAQAASAQERADAPVVRTRVRQRDAPEREENVPIPAPEEDTQDEVPVEEGLQEGAAPDIRGEDDRVGLKKLNP